MKFLSSLLVGLAVLQVGQMSSNKDDIEENCLRNLKLDEDKMKRTAIVSNTPEDDVDSGKFYACIWKGTGLIQENGAIDSSAALDFLERRFLSPSRLSDKLKTDITNETKENCINIQRETVEQTAIKLKNCFIGIMITFGLIPST